MLHPGTLYRVQDYAEPVSVSYISVQLKKTKCSDLIWNALFPDSLKSTTKQKRGWGIHQMQKVTIQTVDTWNVVVVAVSTKYKAMDFVWHRIRQLSVFKLIFSM